VILRQETKSSGNIKEAVPQSQLGSIIEIWLNVTDL